MYKALCGNTQCLFCAPECKHMEDENDMAEKRNLSVDKAKNYKLYNELCNLSKYCYAMK